MATQTTTAVENVEAGRTPGDRLVSLDIFRGIVIAFMILVNDPMTGRPRTGPSGTLSGMAGRRLIWCFRLSFSLWV